MKNKRNTKAKIVAAAWKLFYEQGYDNTTIEEIIDESETSKGSFYHYFEGKDALLGSLADLFDEKYLELQDRDEMKEGCFTALLFLNRELFTMIENSIDPELLTRLYSTQLVTKGPRQLLDHNRVYYKLLRKIVSDAQEKGEITHKMTVGDIVRYYAMCERGLIYDWCLSGENYSLRDYAAETMPVFLGKIFDT